jgi:hypothetical protein
MRRIFLLFVLAYTVFSCNEIKKSSNEFPKVETKKLNEIETVQEEDCILDFEKFFDKFSRDSIFQKRMIKYPLKLQYYDESSYDELKTDLIKNESNYKYIDFTNDTNAMKSKTSKFTVKKKITKEKVIYTRFGYDNGIDISYEFKLIDGCWNLVRITDEST